LYRFLSPLASGFALQATTRQVAQDAEDAELEIFSFAVDPPKIPADMKDGKGKSISVYIVTTMCLYMKLLFPAGMNSLLLSALLSRFS